MHAEEAYLFRHALLREAAYELQPPSLRARLHATVVEIIEQELSSPPDLSAIVADETQPIDHWAEELLHHCRVAEQNGLTALAERRMFYAGRAARQCLKEHRLAQAEAYALDVAQ